ncbi:hypothetical protein MMC26_002335 [Xylographa opegraphella]|nr:hypothetical protein [Xylographa opegraphella]
MALGPSGGYVASSSLQDLGDASLPIFNVERVQLQFSISSDFVAAQVANNVLVLALSTGRVLRIDLDSPADIDDIDLPKKSSEIGLIRRMFLDPSASHLIITTTFGENYYLHTQSKQPKALSRLKGVTIESIGWNPSLPTASTREILVGASDGNIYETYIEQSNEFYRREEKYLKSVYKISDGAVTGIWVDILDSRPDVRRILIASPNRLLHFAGRIGRHGQEGSGSIFTKLFETEAPTVQEGTDNASSAPSALAISPDIPSSNSKEEGLADGTFAWLTGPGIMYGGLQSSADLSNLGIRTFNNIKAFDRLKIPASENASGRKRPIKDPIQGIALTQWHILAFVEGRIIAINRLDERIVYDQLVLDPSQKAIGLFADQKKNTFWLFTKQEIFEIVVNDEERDVWKIMLKDQKYDAALHYACGATQKDAVATASGDFLAGKGQFLEAAAVYGKSSKPFEQVALLFIDEGEQDALRKYLLTKLATFKKNFIMQRVMIASWLTEIFMTKFNNLDDTITTKAELVAQTNTAETKDELASVRQEFQDFITRYKGDLDSKTTYEIISSHGREQELLSYATAINDYNFILSYWVQRERWSEALDVLKKQTDPSIFYKYSSVLMIHVPTELVDILMRHRDLNPRNLIPALLNYTKDNAGPLSQNQAARYLVFCINQLHSTDAAIHNTLISIYASHPAPSEAALLSYLSAQSAHRPPSYDADFALRLCIQHSRVQSCVHIYSLMGQYASAVSLALKHNEIDLASLIADRPADANPALRKKLWLAVAKKVISQQGTGSIKTAIDFLKRCDLLRIEDLIPFFPDFVVIDDFKDEICAALESYSRHIDSLKTEMDESAATAESIKDDIKRLDRRYVIVEPGEGCRVCGLPLLSRQFFVFPSCQHGFHSDCLGRKVVEGSGLTTRGRIRELQASIGRGGGGARREREVRELDALVGKECALCSDFAIRLIEEPFISDTDNKDEWAV